MSIIPLREHQSVASLLEEFDGRTDRGEWPIPVRLYLRDGSFFEGEFFAIKENIVAIIGPRAKDVTELPISEVRAVWVGSTAFARYGLLLLGVLAPGALTVFACLELAGADLGTALPIAGAVSLTLWLVARLVAPVRRWLLRWTPVFPAPAA